MNRAMAVPRAKPRLRVCDAICHARYLFCTVMFMSCAKCYAALRVLRSRSISNRTAMCHAKTHVATTRPRLVAILKCRHAARVPSACMLPYAPQSHAEGNMRTNATKRRVPFARAIKTAGYAAPMSASCFMSTHNMQRRQPPARATERGAARAYADSMMPPQRNRRTERRTLGPAAFASLIRRR